MSWSRGLCLILTGSYISCTFFGESIEANYQGRIGMKGEVELKISDETAYFSGLEDTFSLVRLSDSGCSKVPIEEESINSLLIVAYVAGGLLIVLIVVILIFAILSVRSKPTLPKRR